VDWTGRSLLSGSWQKLGLAASIATLVALGGTVQARGPVTASGSVALAELPREAQQTDRLIRAGGPFPYAKDGLAFGNRERLLPRRERGYYREYTVRIVCGGAQTRHPETCYYTDDHYASFRRIVQ
jgi:ribonuclease T1